MLFNAWGLTDVGRKRDHNEDGYLIRPDVGLYAVADGMGGHLAGEQASQMALEGLEAEVRDSALRGPLASREALALKQAESGTEPAALSALREAARRSGAEIFREGQRDPEKQGMGTTLTALMLHRGRAHIAHVGDSRCYLFRDGNSVQLTEDHSWVNEQLRAGTITEEEARDSRFKHVITRSVGFEEDVLVDGCSVAFEAGDCFLICSDGLSNLVEGDEMARLLSSQFYCKIPSLLVGVANDRGGDDNITVVLIHAANDSEGEATNISGP